MPSSSPPTAASSAPPRCCSGSPAATTPCPASATSRRPTSRSPTRTTPAGRFVSRPGRNLSGEEVVWFDHDAGLAIHRLRPNAAHATRLQRLEAGRPDRRRVSAGCVVVPVAFYEKVVAPTLGRGRGVLYVLPEVRMPEDVFPGLHDD